MYSQCPACATLFRVGDELPVRGELQVRCGMCAEIFDPRRRFADALPPAFLPHVRLPDERSAPEAGPIQRSLSERRAAPETTASANWERIQESELNEGQSGSETDWHLAPSMEMEMRSGPDRYAPAQGTGWWVAGVLIMLLLLIGQVFWFQRDELARYPELRPWLGAICDVAGCELPLRRDMDQLQLLRAQVTDHPEQESALVASAALVNSADFRQPYPLLKLSLLDAEQNVVGERWFHPRDYLEDPVRQEEWQRGMPPQQAVAVRFALRDPGSGSAQYVFDYQ